MLDDDVVVVGALVDVLVVDDELDVGTVDVEVEVVVDDELVVGRNAHSQLLVQNCIGGQKAPSGELKSQSSLGSRIPFPQVFGCAYVDATETNANVPARPVTMTSVSTSRMARSLRSPRGARWRVGSSLSMNPSFVRFGDRPDGTWRNRLGPGWKVNSARCRWRRGG